MENSKENGGEQDPVSSPVSIWCYSVQVGSFFSKERAERLRDRIREIYRDMTVDRSIHSGSTYHRVKVRAEDRQTARMMKFKLEGYGY